MDLSQYKSIFITKYKINYTGAKIPDDKGSALNTYRADLILIDTGNNVFKVVKDRYEAANNTIIITDNEMAKLQLLDNILQPIKGIKLKRKPRWLLQLI